MAVSIDNIAMGSIVLIGGEHYKKVSPMLLSHADTGQLLFDARLEDYYALPPMVEYVCRGDEYISFKAKEH